MPCEMAQKPTPQQLQRRKTAAERLAEQIKNGSARIIGGRLTGWTGDRADWCDGCVLRHLAQHGDQQTRRIIAAGTAQRAGIRSR